MTHSIRIEDNKMQRPLGHHISLHGTPESLHAWMSLASPDDFMECVGFRAMKGDPTCLASRSTNCYIKETYTIGDYALMRDSKAMYEQWESYVSREHHPTPERHDISSWHAIALSGSMDLYHWWRETSKPCQNPLMMTCGHVFASEGQTDMMMDWITRGGAWNAEDIGGRSIGTIAAKYGHPASLSAWLDYGSRRHWIPHDVQQMGHACVFKSKDGNAACMRLWIDRYGLQDILLGNRCIGEKALESGSIPPLEAWIESGGDIFIGLPHRLPTDGRPDREAFFKKSYNPQTHPGCALTMVAWKGLTSAAPWTSDDLSIIRQSTGSPVIANLARRWIRLWEDPLVMAMWISSFAEG
jgi:hypothetical protein